MMRPKKQGGLLFTLVASAVLMFASGVARASHYSLADVPSLVSAGDAQKLQKAGVTTTEDLLTKAAKPKDRKTLAKASGLSAASVNDLARRCDLLRVKGIGPEMVLLLEAAGVKSSADLAKQDPAQLTAASDKANKAKKISEKPPTQEQYSDWIDQAKKLPTVLEK